MRLVALAIAAAVSGCSASKPDDAAVWQAVKARNQSWLSDTPEDHAQHYHEQFARWKRRDSELMRRSDIPDYRRSVDGHERTLAIKVIPQELVWLGNGKVAIAHYTLEEDTEWVGDAFTDRFGNPYEPGTRSTIRIRFSDVYALENGQWRYVGGHKDGMTLPNRGLVRRHPPGD